MLKTGSVSCNTGKGLFKFHIVFILRQAVFRKSSSAARAAFAVSWAAFAFIGSVCVFAGAVIPPEGIPRKDGVFRHASGRRRFQAR